MWIVWIVALAGLWFFAAADSAAAEPDGDRAVTGEITHQITKAITYEYALGLPAEADQAGPGEKRWPMIVDLHGSGVPSLASLKRDAVRGDARFIRLIPRNLNGGREWWDAQALAKLIDHVIDKHPVDPDRVCVIGFSMGGFGAWEFAARYPHKVAGIVPIAGGGNPFFVNRMWGVNVWAFHGAKDDGVPPRLARYMVDGVRRAGGNAKLTVYPDVGHGCRDLVYANPRVFDWMLAQRRQLRAPHEFLKLSGQARRLKQMPAADGAPGKDWKDAATITDFRRALAIRPDAVQTRIMLGYTDTHLCVAAVAWEPHMTDLTADKQRRDENVWEDDSIEVLIDPRGDGATYYQFIINPRGTLYDGERFDGKWNAQGVNVAADAERDDRWTVTLTVPWQSLGLDATPQPASRVRMLFARNHRPPDTRHYYTQWPPTNGKGNHAPELFAPITLVPSE